MRNKLKKIVGTLLTFALAFTIIGGEAKSVNAATEETHGWKWDNGKQQAGQWTTGAIGGYYEEDDVYLKINVSNFLESDETLSFRLSKANGYEIVNEVVLSEDGIQNPKSFTGTRPGQTLPDGKGEGFRIHRNESLSTAKEHYYTITYIDRARLAKMESFTIYIKAKLAAEDGKRNSSDIQFGLVERGTKTIPFSGNGIIAEGMITIKKILKDYMGAIKDDADTFQVKLTGPSYPAPAGVVLDIVNGTDLILDNLELGNYTVAEIVDSKKYTTVINTEEVTLKKNANKATVTITNTEKTRDITAKKVWAGGPDQKPNVTLVLLRNGVPFDEKELVHPMVEATWEDLEARNSQGELYIYTVDEKEDLEHYIKSAEGLTVTNTYTNKTIDISGEKKWVGVGKKPEHIMVKLLRNGVEFDRQEVEEVEGTWKYVFENVPEENKLGVDYLYTVEEVPVPGFTTTYEKRDNIINIVNTTIKADIIVIKVDENEKFLAGAEFTLYQNDARVGESVVTDVYGKATFKDIPYGTYIVKETKAPEGYVKSEDVKEIKIEDTDVVEVEFENIQIQGTVEITKVDKEDHEKVLSGAKFKIVDEAGKEVYTGTTDENGMIVKVLPYGGYTLSEVSAPEGYETSEETEEFNIVENDQVVEILFENKMIEIIDVEPLPAEGTLKITKVDSENNEKVLEGAKFKVVDKTGKAVFEGITNKQGILEAKLLLGEYTLSEVEPPKDYEKTDKTWTVNLIEKDKTVALVIKNTMIEVIDVDPLPIEDEMGTLKIKKVDKETGSALAGVKFRITDKDGDVVFEGLTDANGMIEEELLVGDYTITELEALPGYVASDKPETAKIKTDGEVVELTITNKKMYGLLSIKKVDAETGDVLEGAKFRIVDKDGKEILEDVTDEEGMLEVWLPKGEYIISETEAPEDYIATDETWSVKVTTDGQVFNLVVENEMFEIEEVSPETLPQTGGIPSEAFYILGAFAIFTGLQLTRKRRTV